MTEAKMRVQHRVDSDDTDDQLLFLKQMGIQYVYVMFKDHHTDYDSVMRFMERLRQFDLTATDGGNRSIYKRPELHLALPGRDQAIEEYNAFNRILAKSGIPVTYMTWEPDGVLSTRYGVGKYTRHAVGRIVDVRGLESQPYSHGRFYSKEEMWENFKYFLDRTLPVCEEANIKIALHPNDPPTSCLRGISNLITSAQDYKKAFELSGNSPYLGMKMCVGCWLEGGEEFGDLMKDIQYFIDQKKIWIVHFRNVSSKMPYFEETLLEDGYEDMYRVMKQFVACGYDGMIQVDHVPLYVESCGGEYSSTAYSLGYMKALLRCASTELCAE